MTDVMNKPSEEEVHSMITGKPLRRLGCSTCVSGYGLRYVPLTVERQGVRIKEVVINLDCNDLIGTEVNLTNGNLKVLFRVHLDYCFNCGRKL